MALASGSVPIDAKYKLYEEQGVSSGDVYQAFLYAYAYSRGVETPGVAVLIYPSTATTGAENRLVVQGRAKSPGAMLVLMGLHIPSVLKEVASGVQGDTSGRIRSELGAWL